MIKKKEKKRKGQCYEFFESMLKEEEEDTSNLFRIQKKFKWKNMHLLIKELKRALKRKEKKNR